MINNTKLKSITNYFLFNFISLISFLPDFNCISQERENTFDINGYVTGMQTATFDSIKGIWTNDNLIHNRINLKVYGGTHFTFATELRNRLFTGDMVKINPYYPVMIGADQGWVDMSWNLISEKSFLMNTTIDRLWIDFNSGIFQLRAGRQRINWGQTFVWNPNDIFNAYSFFDFDYVERPGSDAIRIQIYPTTSSTAEFAVKADDNNDITVAGLYRFNRWGYDIQFLAGYVNSEDWVFGTGWSGALGSLSFRGEISWFQPAVNFSDTTGRGIFTEGLDKIFNNNSMVQLQVMYCNQPMKFGSFNTFYSGNLSSKDLAFSKYSVFGQYTYPVTPLLNITVSGIWLPDLKGFFAGPTIDYSLAENTDFSFIWQHFEGEMGSGRSRINLGFLRLKWSF
jgi:hypothetical protein